MATEAETASDVEAASEAGGRLSRHGGWPLEIAALCFPHPLMFMFIVVPGSLRRLCPRKPPAHWSNYEPHNEGLAHSVLAHSAL